MYNTGLATNVEVMPYSLPLNYLRQLASEGTKKQVTFSQIDALLYQCNVPSRVFKYQGYFIYLQPGVSQ
jgi:hypothetical protein